MRFLMMVKASRNSEAGMMPDEKMMAPMMKYNEKLQEAGVLIDLAGLQPSSAGARIRFSGGKHTVVEGPFADPEALVAGYWLIRVNSKQEAIEWAGAARRRMGMARTPKSSCANCSSSTISSRADRSTPRVGWSRTLRAEISADQPLDRRIIRCSSTPI